ncbi:MAG TPA: efflux RND transporter periplasmic adaptor subunit [Bacillus sp. (in: firmicutes)]|nr:efflux RND transporter periplasmic adaptor subunit [Bacillus sp. (in: firmicutes)]
MQKFIKILAILLFLTACGPKEITTEDLENRAVSVKTEQVQINDLSNTVELSGIAVPSKQIPLFSPFPLVVKKVYKKVGDTVRQGDLLLTLDESEAIEQLRSAKKDASAINEAVVKVESAVQSSKKDAENLQQTKRELDSALTEAKQQLTRIQDGNIPPSDFVKDSMEILLKQAALTQQALTQFQSGQSILPQLKQQQQQAAEAVKQAEKIVKATRITSPIDGVVSEITVTENGITPPNAPVMTIIDQSRIEAVFQVNSYVVSQLKKGNQSTVTFDGVEQSFQTQISTISPTANPQTGLFTVQIPIPNEKQLVKGGMKATATVIVESLTDVLVIPVKSVLYEENNPFVFIAKNGKAFKTPVSLGIQSGGNFQVLQGVTKGDKIVVDGKEQLNNGDSLRERKSE